MKYDIWCEPTFDNFFTAIIWWFDMDLNWYICSCIGKESLKILIANLDKITGLQVKESKINAKEEDYIYSLQNIQHRLRRFTIEIRKIIYTF